MSGKAAAIIKDVTPEVPAFRIVFPISNPPLFQIAPPLSAGVSDESAVCEKQRPENVR